MASTNDAYSSTGSDPSTFAQIAGVIAAAGAAATSAIIASNQPASPYGYPYSGVYAQPYGTTATPSLGSVGGISVGTLLVVGVVAWLLLK